jgi:hypothetical protein
MAGTVGKRWALGDGWSNAMNLEALDEFSRGFAKQLFLTYPEWMSLAKSGKTDTTRSEYLLVEVPPPKNADLASPLLIHTDNQEVTVGFDCVHAHFPPQVTIPLFSDALGFITSILSEELAAVSEWEGDTWHASWTIERDEEGDLENEQRPGWRIRVRSWNGTRDRDIVGPTMQSKQNS